eukprot:scaffold477_cov355-Pinguiococcus_pyrenoidosus.AAC.17
MVHVLCLHADDPPRSVRHRRFPSHVRRLLGDLLSRVQDNVQPGALRHLADGIEREVAAEHRQLLRRPGLVGAAKQRFVLGSDLQGALPDAGEIGNEQVLAEGGIAVHQGLPSLLIVLIHQRLELLRVEQHLGARVGGVHIIELAHAEVVQHQLVRPQGRGGHSQCRRSGGHAEPGQRAASKDPAHEALAALVPVYMIAFMV